MRERNPKNWGRALFRFEKREIERCKNEKYASLNILLNKLTNIYVFANLFM